MITLVRRGEELSPVRRQLGDRGIGFGRMLCFSRCLFGSLGPLVRLARLAFRSLGPQPVETRPDLAALVGEKQFVDRHFVVVRHALKQAESIEALSVKR